MAGTFVFAAFFHQVKAPADPSATRAAGNQARDPPAFLNCSHEGGNSVSLEFSCTCPNWNDLHWRMVKASRGDQIGDRCQAASKQSAID